MPAGVKPDQGLDVDPHLHFREATFVNVPGMLILHVAWLTSEVLLVVGVSDVAQVGGLREVRGSLLFVHAPSYAEPLTAAEKLPGGWHLQRQSYVIRLPLGAPKLEDVTVRHSLGANWQNAALGVFV